MENGWKGSGDCVGELKFNMKVSRDILEKILSRDGYVDHDYQASRAASILPSAIDRISELEGYLCEAEARSLLNFQRYEAAIGERHMVTDPTRSWDDLGEDEKELRLEISRKMLHCEDKI